MSRYSPPVLLPGSTRRVRSALASFCLLLLLSCPVAGAFEVEFPGPISVASLGEATSALSVPWEGSANDYLLVGNADGFLSIVRLLAGGENFNVLYRQFVGGRVVQILPWENPDLGTGVVVLATDPDQVVFFQLLTAPPFLISQHQLDLPEDPGSAAFVGPQFPGGSELAVSLPGIDRVAVLKRGEETWSVTQILEAGDRPGQVLGLDTGFDGVRELITADEGVLSGNLGLFVRDDAGQYVRTGQVEVGGRPAALESHDMNQDGQLDLVVGLADQPLVNFFSIADNQLTLLESLTSTLPVHTLHLAIVREGQLGLFSSVQDRGMVEFFLREEGSWRQVANYYPGCRPAGLASGDLNGDGLLDLVALGDDQLATTVMFGLGDGSFRGFPALALNTSPGASDLADFNGDGYDDLVIAGSDQTLLSFFAGQPDGRLTSVPEDQELGYLGGGLVALEASENPGPELALLDFFTGQLRLLAYSSQAGFSELSSRSLLPFPQQLHAGDLDGDGHVDLFMARHTASDLLVLFGDGAGNFAGDLVIPVPTGAGDVLALDINADQRLDLVVVDGVSRVYSYLNQGDRTFAGENWIVAGTGASLLASGDLDGDLDLDLVVGNRIEDSLTFVENEGSGTLVRRIGSHALGGTPRGLACADLNKTGNQDILINLGDEGNVGVVFGLGSWDFGSVLRFAGGASISSFLLGDFNLDGYPDVLNLDPSLQLGLTMLNIDPAQVAVDPQALAAVCDDAGLAVDIQPDRAGPWVLELWWQGGWRMLSETGSSVLGSLDYDGRRWIQRISWSEIRAAWGPGRTGEPRLRLGVGPLSSREYLELALADSCWPDSTPRPPLNLRFVAEPWPNPFNPRVQTRISLESPDLVNAAVFDLRGRRVVVLHRGALEAGTHTLTWDGRREGKPAAGGVYFLKVESRGTVLSRKILLLK